MILVLLITFYYSCTNERVEVIVPSSEIPSQLKIDCDEFDKVSEETFNTLSDNLTYQKNKNVLVVDSKRRKDLSRIEVETINVEVSEVSRSNLNDVFVSFNSAINILAFTSLKNENNVIDGLIIHYLDSKGNLMLESYKNTNGNNVFERIYFPVNLVTNFTLDNLLFIARSIFPKRDLKTIGVSKLSENQSSDKRDYISLIEFGVRYNLLKSDKY